jgi:hypothetical protein
MKHILKCFAHELQERSVNLASTKQEYNTCSICSVLTVGVVTPPISSQQDCSRPSFLPVTTTTSTE